MQAVWFGVLATLERSIALGAVYWVDQFSIHTPANLPYETTLGLMGFALLAMIPVYRLLLPIVYSPWSGHGLPLRSSTTPNVRSRTDRYVVGPQLLAPLSTTPRELEMIQLTKPMKVVDYAGLD